MVILNSNIMEILAIIITIIYGALAGWLAKLFKGNSLDLPASILVGIIGGFIAYLFFSTMGINSGGGWLGYILTAGTGACFLLALLNLFIPRRI